MSDTQLNPNRPQQHKLAGRVLVAVAATGTLLWCAEKLHKSAWLYHDRKTTVQGKGWQIGEYKSCVTVIHEELEYPLLLDCDESWKHEPKIFTVRFWGPIAKTNLIQHWNCKRNGSADPAITCNGEEK